MSAPGMSATLCMYRGSLALMTLSITAMVPAGDNTMHNGEVLAFDKEKGQHLVFYDDGEDEWVDLLAQPVTWQDHARGVTIAHGLPAGEPCPWKRVPGSVWQGRAACISV